MYDTEKHIAFLRARLPEKAFLRFDRGKALFVSDAPRFDGEIAGIEGYECEISNGLMHITPRFGDVPEAIRPLMPEIIKADKLKREKLIRQNLALRMRLHDAEGRAYLEILLKEENENDA